MDPSCCIVADLKGTQKLRQLNLQCNKLQTIPSGCLPTGLRKLLLTGNFLSELPGDLPALTRLQELYLGANRLGRGPPAWLL